MNKVIKFCSIILVMVGMFIMAACSGSSGIKGELSVNAKRNELEVTADFEKNSKLEEDSTTVSVKLYNEDESYNTSQSIELENGIQGSTTFSSLKADTKYILKLFVSIDGFEEEITKLETATKNDGSDEASAITISTKEDFKNIKNDPSAYYKLANDIDFDGDSISLFTSSSSAFKGTFDGGNFTLKNVSLTVSQYTGLFGYASGATIKNFTLSNPTITMNSSQGNSTVCMGAVCGYAEDTVIEGVTVDGLKFTNTDDKTFTSSSAKIHLGGLVGQLKTTTSKNSSVDKCYVKNSEINFTSIKGGSSTTNPSYVYVGLFAGQLVGSTAVSNSGAQGDVTLAMNLYAKVSAGIGGFVGSLASEKLLASCYSDVVIKATKVGSNVNGAVAVGGLVGVNSKDGKCNINDCLAIADIIVLGDADATKANTVKFAEKLYVGGLIGDLSHRSSEGIKNSVYAAKADGIKVSTKILTVEEKEDDVTTTTYGANVSLTIGNIVTAYDNDILNKIEKVNALENKLVLDITAQLKATVEEDGEEKEETIDVEDPTEIKNAITDVANVSSEAINNISDTLKEVYNTVFNVDGE